MLPTLLPIVRQLEETYEAVRISIDQAQEANLGWRPAPNAKTFAGIVEHIASANMTYASVIGPANLRRKWVFDPSPTRELLFACLDESLATARQTIDGITEENLHTRREYDWCPNCEEQVILEPLDGLWFAQQMVGHTAYHLGQLNLYLRLMGIGKYE